MTIMIAAQSNATKAAPAKESVAPAAKEPVGNLTKPEVKDLKPAAAPANATKVEAPRPPKVHELVPAGANGPNPTMDLSANQTKPTPVVSLSKLDFSDALQKTQWIKK